MRKSLLAVMLTVIAAVGLGVGFEPPGPAKRLAAIGPTKELSPVLKRAYTPGTDFQPIPAPGREDWLKTHPEAGQPFEAFRRSEANRPDSRRHVIYLQPMGEFPEQQSPALDILRQYAAAFFQLEVKVLSPISINTGGFASRTNSMTNRRQIMTGDVLSWLKARLPEDAFCMLGITMEDLYPDPTWNFVFGQASLSERVGVYSFARYDPAFYGEERGKDYQALLLRRSMKVLTHETGHMFGVAHCIYFKCVMNGSNHLKESDRRPLHLCPVCLRKLQVSVGFDVVKRYEALAEFHKGMGFGDEGAWLKRRVGKIRSGGEAKVKSR